MIKVVGRSGNFASLLKNTCTPGASSILPIVDAVPEKEKIKPPRHPQKLNPYTLGQTLALNKDRATHGFTTKYSVRYAHTDLRVPSFDDYRRDATKDPTAQNKKSDANRKLFSYALIAGLGSVSAMTTKGAVHMFVSSMSASKAILAEAKIEIKLADIPEGRNMTFKWRGKPLFVRHRVAEEIAKERAVDVSTLRDPQHDSERATQPEWLVVIGICTHLGCVPIANEGDYGGYFCPCHGSHYDASGRIRKGPAPQNLEVPPYEFVDDLLIVG